jgi:hypothetical protein
MTQKLVSRVPESSFPRCRRDQTRSFYLRLKAAIDAEYSVKDCGRPFRRSANANRQSSSPAQKSHAELAHSTPRRPDFHPCVSERSAFYNNGEPSTRLTLSVADCVPRHSGHRFHLQTSFWSGMQTPLPVSHSAPNVFAPGCQPYSGVGGPHPRTVRLL